jgi:transcriptional regulator NrdR family protein
VATDLTYCVYLAGPITGCNEDQRHKWRDDFTNKYGRAFRCEDPSHWESAWDFSREMGAIEACDVVVADMWKESIGTVIGVVNARARGKPVVLVDPNRLHNAVLNGLVGTENVVHDLKAAAERVRAITKEFPSFRVLKKDERVVPFEREKLIGAVRNACDAAGVDYVELPQQVAVSVFQTMRALDPREPIGSWEIKELVYRALERFESDELYASAFRSKVARVKAAWAEKERYKTAEQVIHEQDRRIGELEAQVANLTEALAHARGPADAAKPTGTDGATGSIAADGSPAGAGHGLPAPKTLLDAYAIAEERWTNDLVLLDSARKSVEESPYGRPDKLLQALELLARCARERRQTHAAGGRLGNLEAWFAARKDDQPDLRYVPHEHEQTMNHYANARTFTGADGPLTMEQHLAIGRGDPQSLLRIYFSFDDENGRAVVGHIGRHLPIASRGK